jgi:hypothetical protein
VRRFIAERFGVSLLTGFAWPERQLWSTFATALFEVEMRRATAAGERGRAPMD